MVVFLLPETVDFATGSAPRFVTIGDFDGDKKTDLAVVNLGGTFSVFRNTGSKGIISFTEKIDFNTNEASPSSASVGDFDGDGKSDLVSINTGNSTISVLRNTSSIGDISFCQ